MAKLKKISDLAGVSVSTVSKYFNGYDSVSAPTGEKIKNAAKNLGITIQAPSPVRRRKRLKAIGVIVPDIENPFFTELIKTLEMFLFRFGYFLILCNSDNSVDLELNFIEYLSDNQVDGIILTTISGLIPEKNIRLKNIPTVLIDRKIRDLQVSSVSTDNYAGGKLATSFLIEKGMKNIALIKGNTHHNSVAQERLQGYLDALDDAGLPVNQQLILDSEYSFLSGFRATDHLLKSHIPFDAVFAGDDFSALGVLDCLRERGIHVPGEISVMGFDDIWIAKTSNPRLTTIKQPITEMCKAAVNLMFRTISEPATLVQKTFEPELVIRDSCQL